MDRKDSGKNKTNWNSVEIRDGYATFAFLQFCNFAFLLLVYAILLIMLFCNFAILRVVYM